MDKYINEIVKILKKNEEILSDGYKYYCGEDRVEKTLREIALDIMRRINKR
ncbi:MAG: hypothetical protein U9Q27_00125 [Patescibacteria group bacterium]|nr:hypothetical protein [Patescibacteria group bacterium]